MSPLAEGAVGLVLLFMALAIPERINSAIVGVGGGIDDARLAELPPPPADAPALAGAPPVPAANPLAPARAAPATAAPARTKAKVVDPTSPEITRLAMKGTSATASA